MGKNAAGASGGAIYAENSATMSVSGNASAIGNKARSGSGGAVYVGDGADLELDAGANFVGNTADNDGGGGYHQQCKMQTQMA
jgi:predicted outer membrane repeat protein